MKRRGAAALAAIGVASAVGALGAVPHDARAADAGAPSASASSSRGAPAPSSGASAAASASAAPLGAANAEVVVLHASNGNDGGTGIDPKIGSLPALRNPPFSSYNSYRLVSRTRLALDRASPMTATLPNGRVLQISLRDVLAKNRFRVATSINQPGGTTFLPLLEVTTPAGEPFFVAGQSYQGGMLVVGIKILP